MPTIKLIGFTGEQPRIIPRLMPETAAQSAINCRLDDGALTPMRQASFIAEADESTWQTLYRYQDEWIGWDTVVNAAPGPVATDRLYFTGDGVPKMRVADVDYELAIPPPSPALTATLTGSGSGDVVTRLYVYTWVTSFGEESEPCAVSNEVDWQPGYDVTLSGFATTPADRAIVSQRIYRTQTGTSGTYFYLIAERAAADTDFTDNIPVDALQEPLPSASWNAPPDGLSGLISMPNGMMAAFDGRKLYFCEPYRPHAWPEKYVLTTDATIVGLGALGTTIIVMTVGQPYIVVGSSPETMQMQKLEQNFPCINARGIADLGYAIAYPSNEGVVVAMADGSMKIATGNIFNRDDWLALSPSTMIASQISGRLVLFYSSSSSEGSAMAGALLLDLSGQSFLVRTDTEATAAFYELATGGLFFIEKDTTNIRRLDAPAASRMNQYWKSKQFVLPYPDNFGAILIDSTQALTGEEEENLQAAIDDAIALNEQLIFEGSVAGDVNGAAIDMYAIGGDMLEILPSSGFILAVGVYADKKLVASIVRANRAVRLPSGFTARTWEIDVYGNAQIQNIVMGKTIDDVKAAV